MTWALYALTLALAVGAYRKRKTGLVVWLTLLSAAFFFTGKTAFLVLGLISTALLLGQPLFVLMGGLGIALLATVSGMSSLDEQVLVVR